MSPLYLDPITYTYTANPAILLRNSRPSLTGENDLFSRFARNK
jgi:hypothetical protein